MVASATLALTAAPAWASACEVTYHGGANGFWQDKANWTPAHVPTRTQAVCIPPGEGPLLIKSVTAEVKTITAESTIQIETAGKLEVAEPGETPSRFADLSIASTSTLVTVASPLELTGSTLLEGSIGGDSFVGLTGTLIGNGSVTTGLQSDPGSTIEPGGPEKIGTLSFAAVTLDGALDIDIESPTRIDEIHSEVSENILAGQVYAKPLGSYVPVPHTKWVFATGGYYQLETVLPSSFDAFETGEGFTLELLAIPPEPPAVTGTAGNGEATITVAPPAQLGDGTSPAYTITLQPGNRQATLAHVGATTFTGLTNGTTYTATATVTTTAGASAASGPVTVTPEAPADSNIVSPAASSIGPPAPTPAFVTSAQQADELMLGCGAAPLTLEDVYVHANHVMISGQAASGLAGKTVRLLLGPGDRVIATTTVGTNGQINASVPLPPAAMRKRTTTWYAAAIGGIRSARIPLTRRIVLERPRVRGDTVTLEGTVTPPLTRPVAPVAIEQQLECHKPVLVAHITPSVKGRFRAAITLPGGAKAAIFTLQGNVAARPHATGQGITVESLAVPVALR